MTEELKQTHRIIPLAFLTEKRRHIKRIAALLLSISFFLPLYSCTYEGKIPHTVSQQQGQSQASRQTGSDQTSQLSETKQSQAQQPGQPRPHQAQGSVPRHVEFSAYSFFDWPSMDGALAAFAFMWPFFFQLLFLLPGTLKDRPALAYIELLFCVGTGAGIAWFIWLGHRMPSYAIQYGALIAFGSLAAYFTATLAGLADRRNVAVPAEEGVAGLAVGVPTVHVKWLSALLLAVAASIFFTNKYTQENELAMVAAGFLAINEDYAAAIKLIDQGKADVARRTLERNRDANVELIKRLKKELESGYFSSVNRDTVDAVNGYLSSVAPQPAR